MSARGIRDHRVRGRSRMTCATEQMTEGMSMAARIAVAAGIAGTAVIVSGIIGVVTVTDLGARADNAGSRVSVAKIDVARPVASDSASRDRDGLGHPRSCGARDRHVPAPEPGEVVTGPSKARKTTAAKSEASSGRRAEHLGLQGIRQRGAGVRSELVGPERVRPELERAGWQPERRPERGQGQRRQRRRAAQSQVNAPVLTPKLVQREGIIAQSPVHGNGHDNSNARGHDKSLKSQSRESSPAHRD